VRALDGASDYGSIYSAVQKLRLGGSDIAEPAFQAAQASSELFRRHMTDARWSEDDLQEQRRHAEIMHRAVSSAKQLPQLCFSLGIAYERKWITEAQFNAGEELALLHRLVWSRLRGDIKLGLAKYGADAVGLLLQTGRISTPQPPTSCFRSIVAGDIGDPGRGEDLSPEDYRKSRIGVGYRYEQACAALRGDPQAAAIVSSVVIMDERQSDRDEGRKAALRRGLSALAVHFGYEKIATGRPHATPGAGGEHKRSRLQGLDIVLGSQDGRPCADEVRQSMRRMKTRLSPEDVMAGE
jgi:hypothetical protein